MISKFFSIIFYTLPKLFVRIKNKITILWISKKKNVQIKGNLIIIGNPIIDIRKGGVLNIGESVMLNSRNKYYHLNMHSPVKIFINKKGKIRIGSKTRIHGTCIHATRSIDIGRNCLIAANCQIFDTNGHDISFPHVENRINTQGISKPVKINDNVWVGANSFILPGVTIGYGSIISANSVVVKSIPPMVIAGGNPTKIIKKLDMLPPS